MKCTAHLQKSFVVCRAAIPIWIEQNEMLKSEKSSNKLIRRTSNRVVK